MKNKISFWQLLTNYKVVIPIIQRDYAQGREGKEHIREKFLTQIKNALETDNTSQSGELDFVYGTTSKDGIFYPLDGQQRLTTLWLLHWFIACKAGVLNEAKEILKKFSYETRTSSREFCEKLCDFDIKKEKQVDIKNYKQVVETIQKQPWFYSAWKQDLTIQAMLRMLSGTDKKNEQGHDFIDGIEECFKAECDFKTLWENLIKEDCPVKFSKLEINSSELPVSDDLYIKMNARGKPLTSFENFKADLIDYINRNDQFLKKFNFAENLDNKWTDVFWHNKSKTNSIDEIYLAFINRVFFSEICLAKKADGKFLIENKKENDNRTYKYLNNEKSSYQSFEEYKYLNGIPEATLDCIDFVLNNIRKWESDIWGCSWDKNFQFIPAYEKDENEEEIIVDDTSGNKVLKVTGLSQQQRVVFFAICKFICEFKSNNSNEENEKAKKAFKEWMRVVWNLVSIQAADGIQTIRSFDSMRNVMDKINSLNSQAIYYSFLEQQQPTPPKTEFEQQYKEEIEKAEKIRKNPEWESKIIEAEKFAFFKGAIRFLYTDEKGDINWEQFDEKFKNAKKYFNEKGLIDDQYPNANKIIISYCNNWEPQLRRKKLFGKNADNWRNILLEPNFKEAIHNLLMGEQIKEEIKITKNDDMWLKDIIETLKNEEDIWKEMEQNSINSYQLEWQYGVPCLWLSRYPASTIRLHKSDAFLNLFELSDPKYIRNMDYKFKLNEKQYIWKPYNNSSVEQVEDHKTLTFNEFEQLFKDMKAQDINFQWLKE